jgi:hypothetical protein
MVLVPLEQMEPTPQEVAVAGEKQEGSRDPQVAQQLALAVRMQAGMVQLEPLWVGSDWRVERQYSQDY